MVGAGRTTKCATERRAQRRQARVRAPRLRGPTAFFGRSGWTRTAPDVVLGATGKPAIPGAMSAPASHPSLWAAPGRILRPRGSWRCSFLHLWVGAGVDGAVGADGDVGSDRDRVDYGALPVLRADLSRRGIVESRETVRQQPLTIYQAVVGPCGMFRALVTGSTGQCWSTRIICGFMEPTPR